LGCVIRNSSTRGLSLILYFMSHIYLKGVLDGDVARINIPRKAREMHATKSGERKNGLDDVDSRSPHADGLDSLCA
jgi:hypothetical protein